MRAGAAGERECRAVAWQHGTSLVGDRVIEASTFWHRTHFLESIIAPRGVAHPSAMAAFSRGCSRGREKYCPSSQNGRALVVTASSNDDGDIDCRRCQGICRARMARRCREREISCLWLAASVARRADVRQWRRVDRPRARRAEAWRAKASSMRRRYSLSVEK